MKQICKDYQPKGAHLSKKELVEKYLHHMRRKFGSFDNETGEFLGLLADH